MRAARVPKRLLSVACLASGWLFVVLAAVLLTTPGGALHSQLIEWRNDMRLRAIVTDEWHDLATSTTAIGREGSTPRVVEFVDYRCHYCRVVHDTLSRFLAARPDIAIGIRHLPPPGSPASRAAAVAALCAGQQGRFEEMHRHLMTNRQWLNLANWLATARVVGVPSPAAFADCIRSSWPDEVIRRDSAWAARLGLRGTPFFVSAGGRTHLGAASTEALEDWHEP